MKRALLFGPSVLRIAARAKAGALVNEVFLKRDVHFVNFGNGLYPSASMPRLNMKASVGSPTSDRARSSGRSSTSDTE